MCGYHVPRQGLLGGVPFLIEPPRSHSAVGQYTERSNAGHIPLLTLGCRFDIVTGETPRGPAPKNNSRAGGCLAYDR